MIKELWLGIYYENTLIDCQKQRQKIFQIGHQRIYSRNSRDVSRQFQIQMIRIYLQKTNISSFTFYFILFYFEYNNIVYFRISFMNYNVYTNHASCKKYGVKFCLFSIQVKLQIRHNELCHSDHSSLAFWLFMNKFRFIYINVKYLITRQNATEIQHN